MRALETAAQQPHMVPGQFFKITHKLGCFLPKMCKLYYTSQVRDLPFLCWASLVTQTVKRLPTMWVRFLGQEDSLEKETKIHSSTLAWKIPCSYTDLTGVVLALSF